MDKLRRLLDAHPAAPSYLAELRECLMECLENLATCNGCADACLHEDPKKMLDCIRTCFDCAEVCSATANLLSRVDAHKPALLRAQLEACRSACQVCAAECDKHDNDHCRACAESCRACDQACEKMIAALG